MAIHDFPDFLVASVSIFSQFSAAFPSRFSEKGRLNDWPFRLVIQALLTSRENVKRHKLLMISLPQINISSFKPQCPKRYIWYT